MNTALRKAAIAAGILLAGVMIGMVIQWKLMKPKPVVIREAPEVRQSDGSLVLAVKPVEKANPKHQLPAGATVTGTAEVSLSPGVSAEATTTTHGSSLGAGTPVTPTPLQLDMTFFKLPDGTERVSVSSADASQVVSGVYHPVQRPLAPKTHLWGAGVSMSVDYITGRQVWGGCVTRDLGPFRVGLNVNRDQALAMLMVKF